MRDESICSECEEPFRIDVISRVSATLFLKHIDTMGTFADKADGLCIECFVKRVNPVGLYDVWLRRSDYEESGIALEAFAIILDNTQFEQEIELQEFPLGMFDGNVYIMRDDQPIGWLPTWFQNRLQLEIESGIGWTARITRAYEGKKDLGTRFILILESAGVVPLGSTLIHKVEKIYKKLAKKGRGSYPNPFPSKRGERYPDPDLRWEVYNRDRFSCFYCGYKITSERPDRYLTCDHVVPWGAGGHTVLENLVACCNLCNAGKKDSLPEPEFIQEAMRRTIEYRRRGGPDNITCHHCNQTGSTTFACCYQAAGVEMSRDPVKCCACLGAGVIPSRRISIKDRESWIALYQMCQSDQVELSSIPERTGTVNDLIAALRRPNEH
jgi:hypothetical protein